MGQLLLYSLIGYYIQVFLHISGCFSVEPFDAVSLPAPVSMALASIIIQPIGLLSCLPPTLNSDGNTPNVFPATSQIYHMTNVHALVQLYPNDQLCSNNSIKYGVVESIGNIYRLHSLYDQQLYSNEFDCDAFWLYQLPSIYYKTKHILHIVVTLLCLIFDRLQYGLYFLWYDILFMQLAWKKMYIPRCRFIVQRNYMLKYQYAFLAQKLNHEYMMSFFQCFVQKLTFATICIHISLFASQSASDTQPIFNVKSNEIKKYYQKTLPTIATNLVYFGGAKAKSINYSVLQPYIDNIDSQHAPAENYKFYSYVDHDLALNYVEPEYLQCTLPLTALFDLIPLVKAREIALLHNIQAGSRCTKPHLLAYTEQHYCTKCSTMTSIFLSIRKKVHINPDHKSSKQLHQSEEQPPCSDKQCIPEFPPKPLDNELFYKIATDACARMNDFEEAGCAVCGQLILLKNLTKLKSVKNILHPLSISGITRKERKSEIPIKEYEGPVLDYSCDKICDVCRKSLRSSKVPRLALANGLWLGNVPEELSNLRFVEKLLVARIRHTCSYVKVASGMKKMKANVIAFESPIPTIYNILPPPREDLDDVLAILFTGPCKPTEDDLKRTPFLVRHNYVIKALNWLKLNHSDYADIEISTNNMNQYPEDCAPVSIEYRESLTNKVPEGTSVHDQEIEDGTETGDCSFTVHGLTGENLNTMSTNSIKAMALRHLNNNHKFLAVGHSEQFESIWNNPQLYPQMFPWLFPYGHGGIGTTNLSDHEHKKYLLMYHDKRFQTDVNFPFVAFSHEQIKASTTQSYLVVDQSRFQNVANRLLNANQSVLDNLIERMSQGEYIKPETNDEKTCFQIINDLDLVAGKVHGSITSKKYMKTEIWSLIAARGAPSWYITLSPADIQHPISLYFADNNELFTPDLKEYEDRIRLICKNPVAGARFFDFMVKTFIEIVLGVNSSHSGLYGETAAYYGTVEQQGRLTLHLHMIVWIKNSLNPQDLRDRIMQFDSVWNQKLIDWLEGCHSGDFFDSDKENVVEDIIKNSSLSEYKNPTETLPIPPPALCSQHNNNNEADCSICNNLVTWWAQFKSTVNDILYKSNIHDCERGKNKDGSQNKSKSFGNCCDNIWRKCKARFPRALFKETIINEETGAIDMKKNEPWMNTFTWLVTYLFRCNTDVTCLMSGTAVKAVVIYISDYITKCSLKTHTIFDSVRSVFNKNSEMIGGSLPSKEKARRLMTKVVNLLSAKMEMGAPMICMYLLKNPDHYTDHEFVPFYWSSYVNYARSHFQSVETEQEEEPVKVALMKKKDNIIGISPVLDYIYRSAELEHLALYDWITLYKKRKLPKSKLKKSKNKKTNTDSLSEPEDNCDMNVSDYNSDIAMDSDEEVQKTNPAQKSTNNFQFHNDHPQFDTHALFTLPQNKKRIPNFIGPILPRCDQGDRELFCASMLVFFQPWRSGADLKLQAQSWDEVYSNHKFSAEHQQTIRNFNIKYECLDARDDYRAQLKAGAVTSSFNDWSHYDTADINSDQITGINTGLEDLPDLPDSFANIGKCQLRNNIMTIQMRNILCGLQWNIEKHITTPLPNVFKPTKILTPSEWKNIITSHKEALLEARQKHMFNIRTNMTNDNKINSAYGNHDTNQVKIVDKSFLEKSLNIDEGQNMINDVIAKFKLNSDQKRAFCLVANTAINPLSSQLKMYLGGMGGTGKSQVIKALIYFFEQRKEPHRFMIVAPTGAAAALLGGSTYHYVFGINEYSNNSTTGLAKVRARLNGVDFVFLDEVSMVSARDMYKISYQLCQVFNVHDVPFGGINMVFAGDFAQLPPPIGGQNVSLYGRSIGSISTSLPKQEEAMGKSLWHQITTVVILRENMRQTQQSDNDKKFRTALENMRYKACTLEDINFLRSRVSSTIPGRPNVCDDKFRNVSIITARNIHKDEINKIGAQRFAIEHNTELTDFYSEDSPKIKTKHQTSKNQKSKRSFTIPTFSKEIQNILWNQPPSMNSRNLSGKLSLCVGLPIMIRNNYATELCMTKGQEGFVYGWQSKIGSKNQQVLDVLFVKLKNPPSTVHIDGLPENIVPITPTTNAITINMPNDDTLHISRTQVEIAINFAMTDFASQGRTRPENVSDLNNLSTHQAFYTALSRSATADGTIILQGFSSEKITGKADGGLRQEFRELELLDTMCN